MGNDVVVVLKNYVEYVMVVEIDFDILVIGCEKNLS